MRPMPWISSWPNTLTLMRRPFRPLPSRASTSTAFCFLGWSRCKAQAPATRRGRASEPKPAGPCPPRARSPGRLSPRSAADSGPVAGPAPAAASEEQRRSGPRHRGTGAEPPCCPWQPDGRRPGGSGRPGQRVWWPSRSEKQDATTAPRCTGATCGAPAEHSASHQPPALS
jgi:hypothetical protein